MINPDKRKAVYALDKEGMSRREISRRLNLSRNTVRTIIKQSGNLPDIKRKDKIKVEPEVLAKLYTECDGFVQRIHERLMEEEGCRVGYSTLSRLIREEGLGQPESRRCADIPDQPGEEMQHDTSVYKVMVGDKEKKVVASLLYFRYSKIRYLKFYRSFNRFRMKCFFHEALMQIGYAARVCIIDNTNLARHYGTGERAVIVPEMEQFSKRYGFKFICHEVGHCNRKAGNERGFYTVETNFFPGRKFVNLEDLNSQALEWTTKRLANRPLSKSGLIPARLFEHESAYLIKIPEYLTPPYLVHERGTDQYGYISFDGNFYWAPGQKREPVKVMEYNRHLKIYHKRELLGEYELPAEGVKNEVISPTGKIRPEYKPENRKKPTTEEENKLRAMGKEIDDYLSFAITVTKTSRHRFIRELFSLSQKIAPAIFIKTIVRAHKYRITQINTIERIALLLINEGGYALPGGKAEVEFSERESYQEGRLSEAPDLSQYDKLMEDKDNE